MTALTSPRSASGVSAVAAETLARLRAAGVVPGGIRADSRAIRAGEVFVAWPGGQSDGRQYLRQAVERGACAVLWEPSAGFAAPELPVPGWAVEGLRQVAGELAHLIYQQPSQHLWVAGVTGTNGKTTVSQWIAAALAAHGERCGVIGTLGSGYPGALQAGANTTPGAVDLHRLFAEFRDEGATALAMEVSSIGLEEGRLHAVAFDVALFTNLTHDHLDYHNDMANYAAAKARLFDWPGLQRAVVNLDDPFGWQLAQRCVAAGHDVIGYGLSARAAAQFADMRVLRAEQLQATATGLACVVHWQGEVRALELPVFGDFNVANLLAVVGALLMRGLGFGAALQAVASLQSPAGRMESVGGNGAPLVVVDYAHTPDALEKVLRALRPTAQARGGRLVCVFGCGGNRDGSKRPLMGAVAAAHADQVVLTNDNPRNEAPDAIIAQIKQGIPAAQQVQLVTEADRAQAIAATVAAAASEDVIVLAGKGHETYQEVAGIRYPFADIEHARSAIEAWKQTRGAQS